MTIVDIGKIQYSVSCTPTEEQERISDDLTYLTGIHSSVGTSLGGSNTITLTNSTALQFNAAKTVTTGATQLDSSAAVAKFVAIQNTDADNFITVSLSGDTAAEYVIKVVAGGAIVLEGDGTNLNTSEVYAKADTASVVVKYLFGE